MSGAAPSRASSVRKGLNGGVRVELLTDWPEELVPGAELWDEGGPSLLATRARSRRADAVPVLHLEGVTSREAAETARRPLPRRPRRASSRRTPTSGTTSSGCAWRIRPASRSGSWSRSSAPAATRCTASSARPGSAWCPRCAAPIDRIDLDGRRHGPRRRRGRGGPLIGMRIDIVTIFPELFELPLRTSIIGRAAEQRDRRVRAPRPSDAWHRPPSIGRRLPVRRGSRAWSCGPSRCSRRSSRFAPIGRPRRSSSTRLGAR